MIPKGKGAFIWQVKKASGGDAPAIAQAAAAGGLSHVVVKVADGKYSYNITNGVDMIPGLVGALRARGIQVWGWQYVYGADPSAEAKKGIERAKQFSLDGFVVNAEKEFKAKGMDKAGKAFMKQLRAGLPGVPIALSTYRYPSVHPEFPFKVFLDYCDLSMPQVYWVGSVNPAQQLKKSFGEYQALKPGQIVLPTGAAYTEGNWKPTPQQIFDFLGMARQLNVPGANFWEMAAAQEDGAALWNAISGYNWATGQVPAASQPAPLPTPTPTPAPAEPPSTPKADIISRYMQALNSGDPNKATVLYEKNSSKHVYAGQSRKGRSAIFGWYYSLFKKLLPGARYSVVSASQNGKTYALQWKATAPKAKVQSGKDTIVMSATNPNLIAQHSTAFTISKSVESYQLISDEYSEAGPIPV